MIKGYQGSLYGAYRTRTFSDVYGSVDEFVAEYNTIGLPTLVSEDNIKTLYYLLYANYGNSNIASSDENRFRYKLFSTIWQYGPTWEKELSIQAKLRGLTEDQLMQGSKQIYNNASNPSTAPSTGTDEELTYINMQNVTKSKKGILDAYAMLDSLLRQDVTALFIGRFKGLFITIVQPEEPLLYGDLV